MFHEHIRIITTHNTISIFVKSQGVKRRQFKFELVQVTHFTLLVNIEEIALCISLFVHIIYEVDSYTHTHTSISSTIKNLIKRILIAVK